MASQAVELDFCKVVVLVGSMQDYIGGLMVNSHPTRLKHCGNHLYM